MPVLGKRKVRVASPLVTRQLPVDKEERGRRVCVDNLKLSDDQAVAYAKIMLWFRSKRPLFYLGGYAGSGKTSIAARLCSDVAHVAFCAYTGKASSVLRSKLLGTGSMAEVSTIHSLIYIPDDKKSRGARKWVKREELRTSPELIVVDEASMVTAQILADLESFDVPILLLGDPMQLPPVGGSAVTLADVPESAMLTQVHRQAQDSAILRLANTIRAGGNYGSYEESDELSSVTTKELPFALRDAYVQYGVEEVAMLCYSNKTRQALNDVGQSAHRNITGPMPEYFPGMPVMNLYNHDVNLLNGMRGFIHNAAPDSWWLSGEFHFKDEGVAVEADAFGPQFDSLTTFDSFDACQSFFESQDNPVQLDQETWRDDLGILLDFAYAMTTHKSQGSQFKKVFVKVERPYGVTNDDFQKWMYTSVTRASESLTLVRG